MLYQYNIYTHRVMARNVPTFVTGPVLSILMDTGFYKSIWYAFAVDRSVVYLPLVLHEPSIFEISITSSIT
jgi:hypothetical protein